MVFEHDYKNFPELTDTQIAEFGLTSPHKQITEDFRADVVKVHDGDTVTLRTTFRDFDFPMRFLDIDAPELGEGGKESGDWLRAKLLNNNVGIMIDKDNRVGKFGRLLGRVFYTGMDVGQEMLYLGLVSPFGKKNEGKVPNINKDLRIEKWL